jgi:hypothetical protein
VTPKFRLAFIGMLLISVLAAVLALLFPPAAIAAAKGGWIGSLVSLLAPAPLIWFAWMATEFAWSRRAKLQPDNLALTTFIFVGCGLYFLTVQSGKLAGRYGLGGDLTLRATLVFYGVLMATYGNRLAKLITPYRDGKVEPVDIQKRYRMYGRAWFAFGLASGACALLPASLGMEVVGLMAAGMVTWQLYCVIAARRRLHHTAGC